VVSLAFIWVACLQSVLRFKSYWWVLVGAGSLWPYWAITRNGNISFSFYNYPIWVIDFKCKKVSVICPGSVFWVLPFFIRVAAKFKWVVLCVIYWLCLLTEETTHQFGVGFSIKFWLKLDPMCEWHLEYNFYNFKIQWINFSCVPIGYHRSNKYSIFWNASPEQPRKNKCWVKCLPTTLKISEFVFLV